MVITSNLVTYAFMNQSAFEQLSLEQHQRDLLTQHNFDAETFMRLRFLLANGEFPKERNLLDALLVTPHQGELDPWPLDPDIESIGKQAIERGEVGVAILNGGMATRFGGVVKGIVNVFDDLSFLELKVKDVANRPGRVPIFLMNSFATHGPTQEHLALKERFGIPQNDLHLLVQKIALRLTPRGELFRDQKGAPSFYAPGHGDLFEVLSESASFHKEVDSGMKYILVSNVDNLAATLNPKVIGAHIRANKGVTIEVAEREQGDRGGAPLKVNGRLEIVEGFRLPKEFDHESLLVFNTNTLIANIGVIHSHYKLDWFRVDKTVDNQSAIQFERLMGQITSFVDANYLVVPRSGLEGRFMPIKTPIDLNNLEDILRLRFSTAPGR